jgi:thymidylate synthase (FAD)
MKVELISLTKPVKKDLLNFSSEELTAFVARVSNPSNQMNKETSSKLLGYCIKHNHWSVFEHVNMTVEITTSRAIAAQILRHRSFVFQEFSQRYAEAMDNEFYPARRQDTKNRQNSVDDMAEEDKEWFQAVQASSWSNAMINYKEALKRGVAKEQARFLLPLSTQTTLYMTGNVRNWIHYIQLRSENGTQKEHADIAIAIKNIFIDQFPAISEALKWSKNEQSESSTN